MNNTKETYKFAYGLVREKSYPGYVDEVNPQAAAQQPEPRTPPEADILTHYAGGKYCTHTRKYRFSSFVRMAFLE